MNKRIFFYALFLFLLLALNACGLSPEEVATQTAAAWTSTPIPPTSTPTPTPVPYDLTVSVVDSEGEIIKDAVIVFPESGDDEPVNTDETGSLSWANLEGENANIAVSAQGYYEQMDLIVLSRGPNETLFTMERDPFQLLPSEVCQAGQEVLYIEDFEDGGAQLLEGLGRPLWEFEEDPVLGTYLVGNETTGGRIQHNGGNYGDFVLHFDMVRPVDAEILWVRIRESGDHSYIAVFIGNGQTFLQREGPNSPVWPSRFLTRPDGETWQHISLSIFEGAFDLWIDNELILGVDDPEPFGPGAISIELTEHAQKFYVDNIVICGLTEPYEAPPAAEVNEDG